jgi:hypothetical protein
LAKRRTSAAYPPDCCLGLAVMTVGQAMASFVCAG